MSRPRVVGCVAALALAWPAAASDADVEAADAVRFQAYLHARQYPADCRPTVGVLTRTGNQPDGTPYAGNYFFGLGLGSQLVSLKFNFMRALITGRVYHFPTSHYVNPLRCAGQSLDCYFERPTNCTLPPSLKPRPGGAASGTAAGARSAHRAVETDRLLWCTELPRRRLSRMASLSGVHSKAWYHAQLSAFLFRPNEQMRAYRHAMLGRLAFNTSHTRPADAASAARGGAHNGSCAAMHIRRTDKQKGKRKEDMCPLKPFSYNAHQYKVWAYWESGRPASQQRVLLGSEDVATFSAMPPLLSPTLTYWLPGDQFVMKSFANINDHNERLTATYDALQRQHGHLLSEGDAGIARLSAMGALRDEGMALVLQILLMGECEALFGSYASNVAILVHDLIHARMVSRRQRFHAVDSCGRTYCGCGASFCMKIERRAGREPRRAMRNMVDAFHGDNRNAI